MLTAQLHGNGALGGFIDPGTAQHNYKTTDDYVLVQKTSGLATAVPKNADARAAFEAVQRQINRLLIGLDLGAPIPMTGAIDDATVEAAMTIALSAKTVRSDKNHFIPGLAQMRLDEVGMLGLLRQVPASVQQQLARRARLWASVLGTLADTVWWSTLSDIPPCPITTTKPSKLPYAAVGALGVLVGAVAIFMTMDR